MAGIYIHIPFCRNACHYCDFHFSISTTCLLKIINAMATEILRRKKYLKNQQVHTIYFGGGTPSYIPAENIEYLIRTIKDNFDVVKDAEITLEANPEDINHEFLKKIKRIGINRLSIGIQSFFDENLKFLNRSHDAIHAKKSITFSREAGFTNINIDLIYGIPGLNQNKWIQNIETAIDFRVEHLSAYHLTYEHRTVLHYRKNKKRIIETEEDESIRQFVELNERMKSAGYCHYEISNFAKDGFFSKHNSGYWLHLPYLGIGPSAHSYNGKTRQWNIAKNMSYIKGIERNEKYYETEKLDLKTQYHEYVMTTLRTMWGTDTEYIKKKFGEQYLNHYTTNAYNFLETGDLIQNGTRYHLTDKGMCISDFIIKTLFYEKE
ncbi:MAG: radical SAM family heme chaperone HemW [Bacteroidales bacterium]|nr:radical SAM family heme chaperone HemW [Bacteroidales bacterium]